MAEIFISYSHADEKLRNELGKHLAALVRQGLVTAWHDRQIVGGQEIDHEIDTHLERADIILFLISPDFIASDYCYNKEVKLALERHERGEAVILPIVLRPCDWKDLPFGGLLAAPTDATPVTKFSNIDEAFLSIVEEIKSVLKLVNTHGTGTEEKHMMPGADFPDKRMVPPRSSNLRVKRTFSDRDVDTFLEEAFEYIANYFEASLAELERRNPQLATKFRRIDAHRFHSKIFIDEKEVSQCNIWLSDSSSYFSDGIFYSLGNYRDGSYNESMSVKDDGYIQYLKPMGMSFMSANEEKLSFEGAAEYFWRMLIQYLQ